MSAVENPSGAELLAELRAAARRAGMPMTRFIMPLVTTYPGNFLAQLDRADRPLPLTVARVRALIDGEQIPEARPSAAKGCRGSTHRQSAGEVRIAPETVAWRRDLAELAHAERRPGETLHQAVKRLAEQSGEGE